jgi:ubiquinone biosynthesis protein COQ4
MRWRDAYRAWLRLYANPDDTAAVFEIIEALRGRSDERAYRRFLRSANGPQIMLERPALLERLSQREALRALPEGSLGRSYAAFMDAESIDPDGLVDASVGRESWQNADEGLLYFATRRRDMHDLHHVVTGYGRDLRGEAALLAFNGN